MQGALALQKWVELRVPRFTTWVAADASLVSRDMCRRFGEVAGMSRRPRRCSCRDRPTQVRNRRGGRVRLLAPAAAATAGPLAASGAGRGRTAFTASALQLGRDERPRARADRGAATRTGQGRPGILYTLHPDGTELRPLAKHLTGVAAFHASWSYNGRQILFCHIPAGRAHGADLYLINSDGTGLHIVAPTPLNENGAFWGVTAHR